MIRNELQILVHENQTEEEEKTLGDLLAMSPENLQKIGLKLNPHELMEQIRYRLKARIITYSKAHMKPNNSAYMSTRNHIFGNTTKTKKRLVSYAWCEYTSIMG